MSSGLKDTTATAGDEQVRDDVPLAGAPRAPGEGAEAGDHAPEDREEWWFALGERAIGPVSVTRARELWADGVLTPDSPCWREGFATWVSLFRVTQLAEALAPRRETRPVVDSAASFIRQVERESDLGEPSSAPAAHPAPDSTPETAPGGGPREDDFVSPFVELPVAVEAAAKARGGLRHAVVSGLIAGSMLVAAVVAVRVLWPLPAPPAPIVIYVREPAPPKPATPKLTRAKARPKVAPAAEPRKPKPKANRSRLDEWFAREFAPRR